MEPFVIYAQFCHWTYGTKRRRRKDPEAYTTSWSRRRCWCRLFFFFYPLFSLPYFFFLFLVFSLLKNKLPSGRVLNASILAVPARKSRCALLNASLFFFLTSCFVYYHPLLFQLLHPISLSFFFCFFHLKNKKFKGAKDQKPGKDDCFVFQPQRQSEVLFSIVLYSGGVVVCGKNNSTRRRWKKKEGSNYGWPESW